MEEMNAAPINPLPAAVWVLALPMIAVEVALGLASNGYLGGAEGVGWRAQAYQTLGFAPDQLRAMFGGAGYPATELLRNWIAPPAISFTPPVSWPVISCVTAPPRPTSTPTGCSHPMWRSTACRSATACTPASARSWRWGWNPTPTPASTIACSVSWER